MQGKGSIGRVGKGAKYFSILGNEKIVPKKIFSDYYFLW